jgi:hypothetical protein
MDKPTKLPQRASALQKYLLLHLQREILKTSLVQSVNHFRGTPFDLEKPHQGHSLLDVQSIQAQTSTGTSSPAAVIEYAVLEEVTELENELTGLNEEIKSALTNLFSCDGVHNNERYAMWVRTRLVDAERKLSEFRRKRSKRINASAASAIISTGRK